MEVEQMGDVLNTIDMDFFGSTKKPRCVEPMVIVLDPTPACGFEVRKKLLPSSKVRPATERPIAVQGPVEENFQTDDNDQ